MAESEGSEAEVSAAPKGAPLLPRPAVVLSRPSVLLAVLLAVLLEVPLAVAPPRELSKLSALSPPASAPLPVTKNSFTAVPLNNKLTTAL